MKRMLVLSLAIIIIGGFSTTSHAKSEFLVEQSEYEVIEGVKYTTSYWNEFLWGLSRPFHLYNTNHDGTKTLLPFYLQPMREGGILGFLNPDAWVTDKTLTFGALTADIAILMFLL